MVSEINPVIGVALDEMPVGHRTVPDGVIWRGFVADRRRACRILLCRDFWSSGDCFLGRTQSHAQFVARSRVVIEITAATPTRVPRDPWADHPPERSLPVCLTRVPDHLRCRPETGVRDRISENRRQATHCPLFRPPTRWPHRESHCPIARVATACLRSGQCAVCAGILGVARRRALAHWSARDSMHPCCGHVTRRAARPEPRSTPSLLSRCVAARCTGACQSVLGSHASRPT